MEGKSLTKKTRKKWNPFVLGFWFIFLTNCKRSFPELKTFLLLLFSPSNSIQNWKISTKANDKRFNLRLVESKPLTWSLKILFSTQLMDLNWNRALILETPEPLPLTKKFPAHPFFRRVPVWRNFSLAEAFCQTEVVPFCLLDPVCRKVRLG